MNFIIGLLSISILIIILYMLGVVPYNLLILRNKKHPKGEYSIKPIFPIIMVGCLTAIILVGVVFLVILVMQLGDGIINALNIYFN